METLSHCPIPIDGLSTPTYNNQHNKENMSDQYLSAQNKEDAIKHFTQAIELGVNFKLRNNALNLKEFDELYAMVTEEFPENGMDLAELLTFVNQTILTHSTNYSTPYAMAFPDSGNSVASIAGAILSDFANQNLINWTPCSPMGTIIEMIVINWLRQLVGYPVVNKPSTPCQVGGMVTSGGVASNTIAMLLAREKSFPNTMKNGVGSIQKKYALIVPDGIEHYSSRLSVGWLGMGETAVIKVKTKNFKYDLQALEIKLSELFHQGVVVIALTAYAGDSRSMTCDDFYTLRKLCDQYGIWLHIDGCHGTQLLFSDKLKQRVAGIELADSITFDPHKVLTIPYNISITLVKDFNHLKAIQRPEDIITGEAHSFGQITPLFGSRSFQSLKLYMLMKNLGRQGLAAVIEQRCRLATLLANKICQFDDLVLLNPEIGINSVIFMYKPKELRPQAPDFIALLNALNTDIQQSLLKEGEIWLHNFQIPDSSNALGLGQAVLLRPLRFMSGNPILVESHLDHMLQKVRDHGKALFLTLTLNRQYHGCN